MRGSRRRGDRGRGEVVPVIYAEAKLGELLANRQRNYQSSGRGTLKETPLPPGISKRTSHQAQTLAKNPEKVEVANELYAARVANMAVGGDGSNQHVSKSANMPNSISQPEAARLFNVSERMIWGAVMEICPDATSFDTWVHSIT